MKLSRSQALDWLMSELAAHKCELSQTPDGRVWLRWDGDGSVYAIGDQEVAAEVIQRAYDMGAERVWHGWGPEPKAS